MTEEPTGPPTPVPQVQLGVDPDLDWAIRVAIQYGLPGEEVEFLLPPWSAEALAAALEEALAEYYVRREGLTWNETTTQDPFLEGGGDVV